jgi:hypothetical protein
MNFFVEAIMAGKLLFLVVEAAAWTSCFTGLGLLVFLVYLPGN